MKRDSLIQTIAAAVMIGAMACSVVLSARLSGVAGRYKLVYTDRAEDAQSWEVSAGIAMGAFRGLFVNYLWIRANQLKEDGKFYEAIQLSDAITKLQPRFPRVWAFHAWNMAYNISVATQTPEERWQWVNAGIALLRDRGIPANPNDMLLHKELSWIFLHKIQGYTDDSNGYYKRRLAIEWTVVLGDPPQKTFINTTREKVIEQYATWLSEVADAPDTLDAAIAKEPKVQGLVDELTRVFTDFKPDQRLLRPFQIYSAITKSGRNDLLRSAMGDREREFFSLAEKPEYAAAWRTLLAHTRKRLLIDHYHMDPYVMVRYVRKYGPIDWRHPAAHALYWAERGVENALDRATFLNAKDFDFINTDRQVAQSLQDLFRTGDVYFSFLSSLEQPVPMYIVAPNEYFIRSYGDVLQEMRDRSRVDQLSRGYSPLSAGYDNFLRDAVCYLYRLGDRDQAEEWYTRLRTDPWWNLNDTFGRKEELSVPLAEFVQKETETRFDSPAVAIQQVTASIFGAYVKGLLSGNGERFRSQMEFAKQAHRYYLEEQVRRANANGGVWRMELMDRDFGFLAGTLFAQFLSSIPLDDAESVYSRAPVELRHYAYVAIPQLFGQEIEQTAKAETAKGLKARTLEEIFPRPSDQDQFRVWFDAEMAKRASQNNADIETK